MKECSKCGEEKQLSEYHKDRSKPDGHRPNCKDCRQGYSPEYHMEHKERENARSLKWVNDNREAKRAYDRQYYQDNRERILPIKNAYGKEYHKRTYQPVTKPVIIGDQHSYHASTWEKKYAEQYLIPNDIEFVWHPPALTTPIGEYCPDFYLPDLGKYIEIKSRWSEMYYNDSQTLKINWLLEHTDTEIERLYEEELELLEVCL